MKYLLFLFLACSSPRRPLSPSEQAGLAVRVRTLCSDGPWNGSGVVVDASHVLTAGHVVRCLHGAPVDVSISGGVWGTSWHGASLDAVDWGHDVARLRLTTPLDGVPDVEVSEPRLGNYVCASVPYPQVLRSCGFIKDTEPTNLTDRISGLNVSVDLDVTFTVISGNSGSGVWDLRGSLLGVVTHRYPGGGHATSLSRAHWEHRGVPRR